jgi:hypothetical protein
LQPSADRLWLPLTGGSGLRQVRLLWTYADGEESLDRPRLERPQLEGVEAPSALWTVYIPTGYQVLPSDSQMRRLSAAGRDLRRAAARLALSRLLATSRRLEGTAREQLIQVQQQFYRLCRYADHELDLARGDLPDTGPQGQALSEWLQELRRQNVELAQAHQFDDLRAQAEKLAPPFESDAAAGSEPASVSPGPLLPTPGLATYWHSEAGTTPALMLTGAQERQSQWAWSMSVILVLVLAFVWGVSFFPGVQRWLQELWPEQMLVLGFLSWELLDFGLLALTLLALGLGARIVLVLRRLPRLGKQGPRAQAAA